LETDVLIVGGGLAGLYAAYELKTRRPALRVRLYEALPHVGGRVQTDPMLDGAFRAEYGAVRIEPDLQPLVDAFVRVLGVPVLPITSHEAGSSIAPCSARLTDGERAVLADQQAHDPAWTLLMHAVRTIVAREWDLDGDRLDRPGRAQALARFRAEAQFRGKPLYQQGIWNVLADVMSHEAVEFAREKGAFYNFKNVNPNAADWIATLLDLRLIEQPSYLPAGGMQTLIDYANRAVRSLGVEVHVNRALVGLCEAPDGSIAATIEDASGAERSRSVVTCRHLVLALPQRPLQELGSCLPSAVTASLEAVVPFPITWACCVVEDPWWNLDTSPGSGEGAMVRASHFEVHPEQPDRYGMAMFYSDDPWHRYWANLIDTEDGRRGWQVAPYRNQGERLKEALVKTLQQTFSRTDTPRILEWGIRDWSMAPFGAGVHFWRPGFRSGDVMAQLAAFGIGIDPQDRRVHICGEAYSDLQGFFEGACRSVQRALQHIECSTASAAKDHVTRDTNDEAA
jgi:hypothetical protein